MMHTAKSERSAQTAMLCGNERLRGLRLGFQTSLAMRHHVCSGTRRRRPALISSTLELCFQIMRDSSLLVHSALSDTEH